MAGADPAVQVAVLTALTASTTEAEDLDTAHRPSLDLVGMVDKNLLRM